MTFTVTRLILPSIGALCVECLTRSHQVAPERLEWHVNYRSTRHSVAPDPAPICVADVHPKSTESSPPLAAVATQSEDESASVVALEQRQPPVQVFCFGRPHVLCNGRQVWPLLGSGDAKPWELLVHLACQPAEGISREAVTQALWHDMELKGDGSHRLRQLRYRLRHHLQQVPGASERDGICCDRDMLRLDPGVVWSDVQQFVALVRSARTNPGPDVIQHLERARALYTGELLEGPEVRRYRWIDERDQSGVTLREYLRELLQKASERLAERYAEVGDLSASIDLYRELTEVDPAYERLWLALFRLHARRGDRDALIAEEQRLRQMLRDLADQLGAPAAAEITEPSQEVVWEFHRLLSDLRRAREAQCSISSCAAAVASSSVLRLGSGASPTTMPATSEQSRVRRGLA
jgi:DNA-binding SARP family transcriptional activator